VPVTVTAPGLALTEYEVSVPLDHARPDGERITVFAREIADPDGRERPYLVYLQGGPGFESPRPTRHPSGPGWLDRALEVGDLERALAFYRAIFDVRLVEREPGMAFIDMGDQFLAVSERAERPRDEARHFGLVVDDKEAVRAALADAGVAAPRARAR